MRDAISGEDARSGPEETVREASPDDLADLCRLYRLWTDEARGLRGEWELFEGFHEPAELAFLDAISDPAQVVLLATFAGAPAGYAVAGFRHLGCEDEGSLSVVLKQLFVEAPFRSLSLGYLLFVGSASWGDHGGATRAETTVLPGHREAKNFCELHGLKARSLAMAFGWGSEESLVDRFSDAIPDLQSLPWVNQPGASVGVAFTGEELAVSTELCVSATLLEGGRILLVRRGREPSLGAWSLPGGRAMEGEPLRRAVQREVREETGLEIEISGLMGIFERPGPTGSATLYVICNFKASPSGGILAAGSDVSEASWFDLGDLPEGLTTGLADFLRETLSASGASIPAIYDSASWGK